MKLWDWYTGIQKSFSGNQLRRKCRDSFVSHQRMREWQDVHRQVLDCCQRMKLSPNRQPAKGEAIHRALLSGLLGHVGMWQPEKRIYVGARQLRFFLHPSSALAKKTPPWVFAAELVETSQPFARVAAKVSPEWVEDVAGPLCKTSYRHPHWEKKRSQVVASEQVTLFGLPIVRDRRVHYGPIEPKHARNLFLLEGLVRQELVSDADFAEHNRRVLEQARELRNRARRSDMLVDEDALLPFFDERVPEGVYCGKTFERWRKRAEASDPGVLRLSLADVLMDERQELAPEAYPDELQLFGTALTLSYRFEPSEEDDGVTLTLPLAVLFQADPDVLEWTIPAWHREKIERLLRALPKALRKELAPIAELAEEIALARKPFEGPMLRILEQDALALTGARIAHDAWRLDELPPHMRFFFSIVDERGKVLGQGRDLADLRTRFAARAKQTWQRSPEASWQRQGLTSWSFGNLAERAEVPVGAGKAFAYPALVDEGSSVSLRPMPSQLQANEATRAGVRRLILLDRGAGAVRYDKMLSSSLPLAALAKQLDEKPEKVREQIVACALDEAFGLEDAERLPRNRASFEKMLARGRKTAGTLVHEMGTLAGEIGQAMSTVQTTLRRLAGKPGASRVALDDVREQLTWLLPKGLFEGLERGRLAQLPRYLRGIQVRLERLPIDPRRDADKASQVVPLWQAFVQRREGLLARGVPDDELEEFRWLLEELRVRVFAPELKTLVPVSPQIVAERWKGLGR